MNIHEPSILLEEKGIKMEEEFQIHQKLVHDQKQPKIEKEADNCDQTDDIDTVVCILVRIQPFLRF